MIHLTDSASAKVKAIVQETGKFLRIAVKGGGCSGLQYEFSLSDVQEKDVIPTDVKLDGVLVDTRSLLYLKGSTLDYVSDEVGNSKFTIINPNATSICGCGKSYSI